MQTSFFPQSVQTGHNTNPSGRLITVIDKRNLDIERSQYNKWYCIREILYEQYLWDMRCWQKPKYQYTKAEVMEHIKKWISDHAESNWTNNCGHCLYCIRRLLFSKTCTLEEIADYCLRNNFIKYADQINTWNNGFDESNDDTKQASGSLVSY